MHKAFLRILFLSLIGLALSACHKNINPITPTSRPDLCSSLTGIWQGKYHDTGHLFGDGGPWPIKIGLFYHEGHVVGRVLQGHYGIGHVIFGQCRNNKLTELYFLHSRNECGAPSAGTIIKKNHLELTIHYENAMIGTTLKAQLKQIDYHYDDSYAKTAIVIPKEVKTCH